MKIYDLFTKDALDEALTEKLVKVEKHPFLDLYVYNYTASCMFQWMWDDVTLNCRGLIVNGQDAIIGRPFKKFFSYEQLDGKLPEGNFVVEEKMDGSMLIAVNYQGNLVTSTRGSFVSEQAKDAQRFLKAGSDTFLPEEGLTYIFEYLSDWNRIIVKYDFEGLVLLGVLESDGTERNVLDHTSWAPYSVFRTPKIYSFQSLDQILSCNDENIEGFVLKFDCGTRVKCKTDDYKRLHRLITGLSEKTIWEALKENRFDSFLEDIPDEAYDFVTDVKEHLEEEFDEVLFRCLADYGVLKQYKEDRKMFAINAQQKKYPSILFKILDGQDYSNIIWKLVRPEVTRVFKMVSEDSN